MPANSPIHWITVTSPTIEAVVNPFAAACERGIVPDRMAVLQNPDIATDSERACEICEEIAGVHGQESLEIDTAVIDSDRDFGSIVDFYKQAIGEVEDNATVAVNVTPGRKFMSAIAFQAGMQYGADHVYYFYLDSSDFYDRVYPDVPRTGADLVDFTKVFG